jgi:hypothetical protein
MPPLSAAAGGTTPAPAAAATLTVAESSSDPSQEGMAEFAAALRTLVDSGLMPPDAATSPAAPPPLDGLAPASFPSPAFPTSPALSFQMSPSAFSTHATPSPTPPSPVLPPSGTDFTLAPLSPATVNANAQAGLAALLAQLTPTT